MATIGIFTKSESGYTGSVRTLMRGCRDVGISITAYMAEGRYEQ